MENCVQRFKLHFLPNDEEDLSELKLMVLRIFSSASREIFKHGKCMSPGFGFFVFVFVIFGEGGVVYFSALSML